MEHESITISEFKSVSPDVNERTLRRYLSDLVEMRIYFNLFFISKILYLSNLFHDLKVKSTIIIKCFDPQMT